MVLKVSKEIDSKGRIHFPEKFLYKLDDKNLFLTRRKIQVRKGGLHKYIDLGKRGFMEFNFLEVTDRRIKPESLYEELHFPESNSVETDESKRTKLECEIKEYAGIKKEYVMVRLGDPYSLNRPRIWIWNKSQWEKFYNMSKKHYPFDFTLIYP